MCLPVLFFATFVLLFVTQTQQKITKEQMVNATLLLLSSTASDFQSHNKSYQTIFFYQQKYAELANMLITEWGKSLQREFSVFEVDEHNPSEVMMDELIHFGMNFQRGTIVSMLDEFITKPWIRMLAKKDHRSLWLDHIMFAENRNNYYKYKQICSPEKTIFVILNNMGDENDLISVNFTDGIYKAKLNPDDHRQKSCHYLPVNLNWRNTTDLILDRVKTKNIYQDIYVGYAQKKLKVQHLSADDDDDDDDHMNNKYGNQTMIEITGLEGRLIEMLLKKFVTNMTHYKIGKCHKSQRELPKSIGPRRSLIDMLLNQDIDVAISRIPLTEDLIHMMDHSPVYYIDRFVLLSQSRTFSDNVNLIFRPIHHHIWYLISSSMFGIAPLYVLLEWRVRGGSKRPSLLGFVRQSAGALFYIYRIFFGCVKAESRTYVSLRLFSFVWAIAGLIFGICYNSMFTAAISSNSIEVNVNTLAQLKHKLENKQAILVLKTMEDVIIGPIKDTNETSIYSDIFNTASRNQRLQVIENNLIQDFMVANPSAVLVLDRSSSYNMAVELRNLTQRNYHISSDDFGWEMYAIIRRRGFPGKRKWDKYLWKILESGTIGYWYKDDVLLFKTQYKYETEKLNENVPLLFTHFTSLWYIYATGMAAGTACLILELAIFKWKSRQKSTGNSIRPKIIHRKMPTWVFKS